MAGSSLEATRRKLIAAVIIAGAMAPALAAVPLMGQPAWAELPPRKQQILAPLASEWNGLESSRKKRWLEIADRYPRMTPEEQARVQQRMKDWAKLTPEERKAARESYQHARQASPEQREALKKRWSEYETLPAEEKDRFKQSAASKGDKPSGKSALEAASKSAPPAKQAR